MATGAVAPRSPASGFARDLRLELVRPRLLD